MHLAVGAVFWTMCVVVPIFAPPGVATTEQTLRVEGEAPPAGPPQPSCAPGPRIQPNGNASGGSVLRYATDGCWAEWRVRFDEPVARVVLRVASGAGEGDCSVWKLSVDSIPKGQTDVQCSGGVLEELEVLNGQNPVSFPFGARTIRLTVNHTSGSLLANASLDYLEFTSNVPECRDGLDNDEDGLTDDPLDPGCDNVSDDDEGPATLPCTTKLGSTHVCLTEPQPYASFEVTGAWDVPPGARHHVGGFVDQYSFDSPAGGRVIIPCVVLLIEEDEVSPCQDAGGTKLRRDLVLVIPVDEPNPQVGTLTTLWICRGELTVTVSGYGIADFPGFAPCLS